MNCITFAKVAASPVVELIIVEPDLEVAKVIALPFERNGYRITIVSREFESALVPSFAGARAFFVVNRDCLDASSLERIAGLCRQRVIFTSAWNASEVVETYGLPCFQKPFSPKDLYRTVEEMLQAGVSWPARQLMAKRSEEVVERLRCSSAQSIRRLAAALDICKDCQRRCPGPSQCSDVQSVLEWCPDEVQS